MSKVSGSSPSVKSKAVYRVQNWASYNRALVARGSLTVWIDDCLWKQWYDHRPSQRGAQFVYSDQAMEWMLTMRVLFGLPLRQTHKHKVFDALATPPSGPPIRPIIALRKDAKIQQHGNSKEPPLARDEILRAIRRKGRKGWKQESGYHRRSLAETLIYRYKHLISDTLKARSEANQQVESRIGCAILNRMIQQGKPQSERIEKRN